MLPVKKQLLTMQLAQFPRGLGWVIFFLYFLSLQILMLGFLSFGFFRTRFFHWSIQH